MPLTRVHLWRFEQVWKRLVADPITLADLAQADDIVGNILLRVVACSSAAEFDEKYSATPVWLWLYSVCIIITISTATQVRWHHVDGS